MSPSTRPHEKIPHPPGKGTAEALIESFLEFKQLNQGRSLRTIERYSLALRRLAGFMGERGLLAAATDDLTLFSGKWLFEHGVKDPVSRKPCVAAVREFYKWLHRSGYLQSDPGRAVPHPKFGRRLPRVMSLAQAEALMYVPDYSTFEGLRDATMISLLLGCGLRVSGLVGLNEGNLVPVLVGGRQRLVLRTTEKGGKERQQPVPEQADLLLRLYLDHATLQAVDRSLPSGDKVLFISTRNSHCPRHEWHGEKRRINRHSVHAIVERYGKRAGLPPSVTHPHAIRHLFGTELAEDDVPTVTAQSLLGHADPKTTAIYQHLAVRKLTQVVDKSNPLGKIKTPVSSLLAQLGR